MWRFSEKVETEGVDPNSGEPTGQLVTTTSYVLLTEEEAVSRREAIQ